MLQFEGRGHERHPRGGLRLERFPDDEVIADLVRVRQPARACPRAGGSRADPRTRGAETRRPRAADSSAVQSRSDAGTSVARAAARRSGSRGARAHRLWTRASCRLHRWRIFAIRKLFLNKNNIRVSHPSSFSRMPAGTTLNSGAILRRRRRQGQLNGSQGLGPGTSPGHRWIDYSAARPAWWSTPATGLAAGRSTGRPHWAIGCRS